MPNKLTPIEKYLRTLPLDRIETILKMAESNRLAFRDTCKCLLGVAGGGTEDAYIEQLEIEVAVFAEAQFRSMGGHFVAWEQRDAASNKAIIPYLSAEIARRNRADKRKDASQ